MSNSGGEYIIDGFSAMIELMPSRLINSYILFLGINKKNP
ncbi:MAG: hypothetical protein ACJA1K_000957 [Cognaticolwellia sp.]|jgi:hypothetical protein